MTPTPASEPTTVAFACPDCGEQCVASTQAWIDHARATHRCPTPERLAVAKRITMALQGWYDG
jgi:hypothetical protein